MGRGYCHIWAIIIGCVVVQATILQGTEIGGKLINLPASVEDFILPWRNQELTIKKFKSANLNLLTSQFNSKESFDLGSLFLESRDLKTRRAFGSFVSYKLAKVS